jgi:hypothetical protein
MAGARDTIDDRLRAVEGGAIRFEARFGAMERQIAENTDAVKELTGLLHQAKGARWAILTVIGMGSALASAGAWVYARLGH